MLKLLELSQLANYSAFPLGAQRHVSYTCTWQGGLCVSTSMKVYMEVVYMIGALCLMHQRLFLTGFPHY